MLRNPRIVLLALVFVVVLANVWLIAFTLGRPTARPPLPSPNGYDDFLKAAALLTGDVYQLTNLNHDGLRALVAANAETLRLLELGLTRNCSVPTDSAMTNVPGMMSDLVRLKSLARLLTDEGQLAEIENRYADAAHSYLNAMRFGNEMSRGGLIVNRLAGVACEAIGASPLAKLVPKLTPDEARSVVTALEKADSTCVTWEEVRRNEGRFSRYQLRKGFNPISWALTRWQRWRSMRKAEAKHRRIIAHERLLTAELALRCYQSEQGRAPTSLEQLVPQYLQRVPSDPFSGRPVIYRPQGTNWLSYSVGEDGVDDGGQRVGRPVSGSVPGGDLFYDSQY